jgi:AGCS family alanine or glycine:cation symporter
MTALDLIGAGIDRLSGIVFFEFMLLGVPVQAVVVWLAIAMLFSTLWLGFPQIRGFREGWHVVRGRRHDPTAPGEVSQFAALTTALSGTVGLGNIAGVAVAVGIGGPGAVFWLMVIGLFAMALKSAEVTLGLMYRDTLPDGRVRGGAFVTLRNGLAAIGRPRLGRSLGLTYAFLLAASSLISFQVNQSYAQVSGVLGGIDPLAFGIVFALAAALVILGSIRWIARVTSWLVPVMAVIYIGGCLAVLGTNLGAIPDAIGLILGSAFAAQSVTGGLIGAFVAGMRRAVFSSEAGIGTAVVAHAQARTREPASEGMVALLEPFIDTVLICTLTGLTIVVAGVWNPATNGGVEGVAMTSAAFATVAPWFPAVLAIAVLLFAFSTVISYGFYGGEGFQHLAGHGRLQSMGYKIAYCALLPLSAVLDLGKIVDLIDSFFFLMAIPNIIGLYLLAGPLRREVNGYLARTKRSQAAP